VAEEKAGADPEDGPRSPGDVDEGTEEGTGPARAPTGGAPRPARRGPWALLVLVALVIGVGAGWSARAVTTPVITPAPVPPPSAPTPVPGVPCPAAADAGAAIRAQLDRAVGALRDFDPRALQDVLDEVQRQQARLEAAVAACRGTPP
jgi:hypothetical protein